MLVRILPHTTTRIPPRGRQMTTPTLAEQIKTVTESIEAYAHAGIGPGVYKAILASLLRLQAIEAAEMPEPVAWRVKIGQGLPGYCEEQWQVDYSTRERPNAEVIPIYGPDLRTYALAQKERADRLLSLLPEAYKLGWCRAAEWAGEEHLKADTESPAYIDERDDLLGALSRVADVVEGK